MLFKDNSLSPFSVAKASQNSDFIVAAGKKKKRNKIFRRYRLPVNINNGSPGSGGDSGNGGPEAVNINNGSPGSSGGSSTGTPGAVNINNGSPGSFPGGA